MPWTAHSQNLAPSTIQGPASLDKESLLCGPASSRLISSQRTSIREASAACLAPSCAHVVSGLGPEQDRARRITSRARQNSHGMRPPGPTRPAEVAFLRDQYTKDCQKRLYHQDIDFHVPAATRLLERSSLASSQHRDKGRIVRGRLWHTKT